MGHKAFTHHTPLDDYWRDTYGPLQSLIPKLDKVDDLYRISETLWEDTAALVRQAHELLQRANRIADVSLQEPAGEPHVSLQPFADEPNPEHILTDEDRFYLSDQLEQRIIELERRQSPDK
jgi:hypothetical protein